MSEYTIEQVNSWFEEQRHELTKLVYDEGETGWALDIGDSKAVIANVPLSERLRFKDIVAVTLSSDGRPMAGEVLWRMYARTVMVRYPADTEEVTREYYAKMHAACAKAGLALEGCVAGLASASCYEDTELGALFDAAGIDTSKLQLKEMGS